MSIDHNALKQRVLKAAKECAERGASYSQQTAVLGEVASALGGNLHTQLDPDLQQVILTCWHDLFRDGVSVR
jgi:hypothetical protein